MEGPVTTAFLLYPPYTALQVGQPLPAAPAVGKKRKAAKGAAKAQEAHKVASPDAVELLRLFHEDAPRWLTLSKAAWSARRGVKAVPKKSAPKAAPPSSGGGGPAPPRQPTVTLSDLLAAGLLAAGCTLYLNAFGSVHTATLTPAGRVVDSTDRTIEHGNPSAWALHVKRRTQPGLRTEAGWRNVRTESVTGKPLEELKQQFLALTAANAAA